MANGIEKRRYKRYDYQAPLLLYRDEALSNGTAAELQNYSIGGMFFKTQEALDIGQELFIKIRNYDPSDGGFEKYDRYIGYVKWSDELGTSQPAGPYGYGVEYTETVTY